MISYSVWLNIEVWLQLVYIELHENVAFIDIFALIYQKRLQKYRNFHFIDPLR